ncbi:MAG: ABC transporter permease, partial [Cellulomonadaceae bacterium]|nr:ABC transporter permease [Cellulomonadaceae bacterium]
MPLTDLIPIIIALALLTAVAVAVLTFARAPIPKAVPVAVIRAIIQLGIIALVLRGVITNIWWVCVALVVMFTVAASTSTKRLGFTWRKLFLVASAMIVGVLVALGIVFLTGAIEFSPRYILALGGIVIGNSMSIATLAGRRLFSDVNQRWDEVEGW